MSKNAELLSKVTYSLYSIQLEWQVSQWKLGSQTQGYWRWFLEWLFFKVNTWTHVPELLLEIPLVFLFYILFYCSFVYIFM